MKIYTRGGDAGETGLFGGARVHKDDPRVCAYGALDEANAAIGVACAAGDVPADLVPLLQAVMSDLFDVGAELATPEDQQEKLGLRLSSRVDAARVLDLEALIDAVDAEVPPLSTFILPSGTDAAARLHLARTVLRRAERELVSLSRSVALRAELLAYVNRLSDALFAWARLANHRAGRGDMPWQKKAAAGASSS
jgi:cob(I)alamin adenosyltransferase